MVPLLYPPTKGFCDRRFKKVGCKVGRVYDWALMLGGVKESIQRMGIERNGVDTRRYNKTKEIRR